MHRLTYRITTLGCRVNHAETRDLESILRTRGLVRAADTDAATLEVIHTCSVTQRAASRSRAAIRQARRRSHDRFISDDGVVQFERCGAHHHPSSIGGPSTHRRSVAPPDACSAGDDSGRIAPGIIVTGCFAGTDPNDAAALAGSPESIVPHDSDDATPFLQRFSRCLDGWLSHHGLAPPVNQENVRTGFGTCSPTAAERLVPLPAIPPAAGAGRHTRAELRIQDGCDAHCTFCIIPKIRRPLRSKRLRDAIDEARQLIQLGHREIVLTGIFIGAYGHETAIRRRQQFPDAEPLAELLDALASLPGLERLRISSMEPGDVTLTLLDAMAAHRRVVVPHLHLPLQSGSDAVLRRMNRQYTIDAYLEMIDSVNTALTTPDGLPPAITTDIICGFPGETDSDFARTLDVARRVGYLHMHVFPFSPRKGTAAARWHDRFVPPQVIRERVRALHDLEYNPEAGTSIRYRRHLLGRRVRMIVEHAARDDPSRVIGRCDHYVPVCVAAQRERGTVLECRVSRLAASGPVGGVLETASYRLPVLH